MVVCIALGVDDVLRGSLPALIYRGRGDMITWKVLAEYSWSPTTTQSGSFLCTAASSIPIRVVTKEVRYIHELFLTLEHSISISSPAVLGLTGTRQDGRNMPGRGGLLLYTFTSSYKRIGKLSVTITSTRNCKLTTCHLPPSEDSTLKMC